jgi:hypothetical protein
MASSGTARSKVVLCAIAFAAAVTFFSGSVETVSADERSDDALRAGSWALQFGISSNFTLISFEGLSISAKKHFSPSRAIRFGTTIAAWTEDVNMDDLYRSQDHQQSSISDADNNSLSWDISALYLFYPGPRDRLSFFAGLGPDFGYSRAKHETNTNVIRDGQVIQDAEQNKWTYNRRVYLGLRGVLGAEWFATKRISLIADYSLSTRYMWEKSETSSEYTSGSSSSSTDNDRQRFDLYSSAVQFGISVYF